MKNIFNKKVISLVAILIVLAGLIVFFASRSSDNSKKSNKKADYSFDLDSFSNNEKISSLHVIFKNDKLDDIIVTFYFDDKQMAKEVAALYKDEKLFKDIEVDKTNVKMHYNEEDIMKLSSLDKNDIIIRFEEQGYVYRKTK